MPGWYGTPYCFSSDVARGTNELGLFAKQLKRAAVALVKFPRRSRVPQGSRHALQGVAQYHHDVVDMGALDNQRRRHCEGVAGVSKHEAAVEAVDHDVVAACA